MMNDDGLQTELYLRLAEEKDCDLLFKWANDETTRKNSFNTKQIKYEDHIKWYKALLEDRDRIQYILMRGNEPIGQVRFDFKGEIAEIGYSIDEFNRGSGYGKIIIALAVNEIIQNYPIIQKVVAKVKPSNVASIYCFINNGFHYDYNTYSFDITECSEMLDIPRNARSEAGDSV